MACSYSALACLTSPSAPRPPFSPANELTTMPSQTSGSLRPGKLSLTLWARVARASKRFSRSEAGVW